MNRIRQRSVDRFGERVLPGGDLYESEENFFAFAAKRTPEKIEKWLKNITCPAIRLDSRKPTDELVCDVVCFLKGERQYLPCSEELSALIDQIIPDYGLTLSTND